MGTGMHTHKEREREKDETAIRFVGAIAITSHCGTEENVTITSQHITSTTTMPFDSLGGESVRTIDRRWCEET